MAEQDGDAYQMAYDCGSRRAGNAPSEPLYENDVETEIGRIVDDDSQRHEFGLPINAHHGRKPPHEDEGRVAQQQNTHIVGSQGEDMLVATEQTFSIHGYKNPNCNQ